MLVGAVLCKELAQCLRRLVEHAREAGCSGKALARVGAVTPAATRIGFLQRDPYFYSPSQNSGPCDPIAAEFAAPFTLPQYSQK